MRLKKYLTILALTLYACSLQAQTGKFFSADKQLSSSFVTQVYLDKEGFIWVTTRDGINRYDGYQFRVFSRTNETDKTLASNYVNTMLQDRDGLFYFGMYGALQTWDGRQFYNVTMTDLKGQKGHCYANCFLQRKNGDVLAGTSGLGVMKFTDKTHAKQIGGALADLHTINSMIEDKKGRLWLVTDSKGLLCYDGQKVKRYLADRTDLHFSNLCEDHEGVIYVGTNNAGVFRLQGSDFVHIDGKRFNARPGETTTIRIHSNLPEISLYADGELIETKTGDKVYVFENVPIRKEGSVIAAYGKEFSDSVVFRQVDKLLAQYSFESEQKGRDAQDWIKIELDKL